MALSSGCLVTSIISPRAGKVDPDCSKAKLTIRLHPREYFPAFYAYRCACVIHFWIHVPRAWRVYLATGFDFREKIRVFLGSIGGRVCFSSPTLPLYYEGKVMKTTFPKNYVYVLRTTKTRHMVSFINFYFHFPANFQT